MIEGPTPASPRPGRPPKMSLERLFEPLRKPLASFGQRFLPQHRRRDTSDALLGRLQLIERIFWVILAGLGVYLVIDLGFFKPQLPSAGIAGSGSAGGPADASLPDQLKPMAEYRETLLSRNPFGLSATTLAGPVGGEQVKGRLAELAGALTVVGINRGRVPEALIEDTTAKRTHIVKVGDQINQLTVTAIDANGVTVTYEGEETVLH